LSYLLFEVLQKRQILDNCFSLAVFALLKKEFQFLLSGGLEAYVGLLLELLQGLGEAHGFKGVE